MRLKARKNSKCERPLRRARMFKSWITGWITAWISLLCISLYECVSPYRSKCPHKLTRRYCATQIYTISYTIFLTILYSNDNENLRVMSTQLKQWGNSNNYRIRHTYLATQRANGYNTKWLNFKHNIISLRIQMNVDRHNVNPVHIYIKFNRTHTEQSRLFFVSFNFYVQTIEQ